MTATALAPDSRLRRPKRALPRGTVDCHAHIFDRFERYPLAPGRKYSPPVCARESWMELHTALGVERGVQVHGSPYGFDNSITEDFLLDFKGRFVGVAAVPLAFDHLGRVRGGEGVNSAGFKVILRQLTERDDRWTKISSWYRLSDSATPADGFSCLDMKPLAQALLRERADRCVWGTNWPHPGLTAWMPNDADVVDQLESWLPSDAVREPLFAGNAAKLYRF